MNNTSHPAVLIIAVLSLLLGLSLGQIHQTHRAVQAKDHQPGHSVIRITPGNHCNTIARRHNMERIQAELAREQARLEREKVRLEREVQRAIHRVQGDKIHIIIRK